MSGLPLDLHIVTFNCGRVLLDIEAFAANLFKSRARPDQRPDLIVFTLQEVAPLAYSFLGGSFLAPYFARFIQAAQRAAGPGAEYRHLITHNVGMTGIVILIKPELALNVQWLQTAEVGVGWYEMGNKGAAGVRIGYKADGMSDLVPLTLVAAHLAPGEDSCERRNDDWWNIARRLAFKSPAGNTASLSKATPPNANEEDEPLLGQPSENFTSKIGDQGILIPGSPVFFAGDLNYRTSDTGPEPNDAKGFPQPANTQGDALHWSRLFAKDQLSRERKAKRTLHALTESSVTFPPTYKFSEKQQESMSRDQFLSADADMSRWHWASHRWPSWCDRVLYSQKMSEHLQGVKYEALQIQPTSDHRPVAFSCKVDLEAASKALEDQQVDVFKLEDGWQARRHTARREEVAVGIAMYLGYTYEGNALLVASLIGVIGGWWVLSSLVSAY